MALTSQFLNSERAQTITKSLQSYNTITEEKRIRFESQSRRFIFTLDYEIPRDVSKITIRIRALRADSISVLDTANLSRQDGDTFVWDGGRSPQIELERHVGGSTLNEGISSTVSIDDTALAAGIVTQIRYWYGGDPPTIEKTRTFEGEGFAGDGYVFAGPHTAHTETVNGTELAIVIPDNVQTAVPHEDLLEAYTIGEQNITPRIPRDQMTVFVTPSSWGGRGGYTVRTSVIIHARVARIDEISSIATHEYVHTSFGVFGGGKMYWLTEAVAQYYGYLLAYNAGAGDFETFIKTAETTRYQDAVLTDTESMRRTNANYQKGAHVLAALDAEIQQRTNGSATLSEAVSTDTHELDTYAGFTDAVVEVAGDSDMREWLETYVQSSALPDIPQESTYFSWGTREPESTQPEPTPEPSVWETEITEATDEFNSSVETTENTVQLKMSGCSSGMATRSIDSETTSISFDYEFRPGSVWGYPYVELLEDGEVVWRGSDGPGEYDERVFKIRHGAKMTGSFETDIEGSGELQLRFGVTPTESCSVEGWSFMNYKMTNIELSQTAPSALANSTSTNETPSDNTTSTANSNSTAIEEEVPGFGFQNVLLSITGVLYLVKRQLDTTEDN